MIIIGMIVFFPTKSLILLETEIKDDKCTAVLILTFSWFGWNWVDEEIVWEGKLGLTDCGLPLLNAVLPSWGACHEAEQGKQADGGEGGHLWDAFQSLNIQDFARGLMWIQRLALHQSSDKNFQFAGCWHCLALHLVIMIKFFSVVTSTQNAVKGAWKGSRRC